MKKYLFVSVLILIGFGTIVKAQQLPLYTQYMLNDFYLNPAIAGSKDYTPIVLGVHKQWVGIENSPTTQTISGHTRLSGNNVGVGGVIFNDTFGPERHTGLQATYAYHFHIDRENSIGLGLAATVFQYHMDQRHFEMTVSPDLDPAISGVIEQTIVPDAIFGVYAYGKKYWAGITALNLFESKLKINKNLDDNTMVRHYWAMGGYRFDFDGSPEWEVEPSALVKMTEVTPPQFDINLKIIYNGDYWFGFSIRPEDSFIACVGMRVNQYYFGLSYDFTFSDLSAYTIGSTEIVFGINIGEGASVSRSFF